MRRAPLGYRITHCLPVRTLQGQRQVVFCGTWKPLEEKVSSNGSPSLTSRPPLIMGFTSSSLFAQRQECLSLISER